MITLITLIILNLLLLFPLLLITIPNTYYKRLFNYTLYYCQNFLGYVIAIVAKIRTGKTTLLSGLSHVFQLIIINKNNKIMEDIRDILYYINFNELEYIIIDQFTNDNQDLNYITDVIIDYFELDGNRLYYDFLEFKPIKQLIYDYVEAFYVVNIRQQYVYSKTYVYSHITHKPNLKYDLNWTKIKEAYNNKNYSIFDNMIELIDEYSDDFGYGNNWNDIKDETGAREYRRKYGHLHKEKNFFIYTKQDSSDEVKKIRNLTQSHLYITEKVKVVNNFSLLNNFLQKLYELPNKINIYRFTIQAMIKGYFTKEKRESYIDYKLKETKFGKKFQYKIFTIKRFLFSLSYCQFIIRNYYNEEDVGKENTENKHYYDPLRFVIPLKYCFGTFTRFEFNYIQQQLIENTNIDFEDLIESTMFPKNKRYFDEPIEQIGGVFYDH